MSSHNTKEAIQYVIDQLMTNVMHSVLVRDPFLAEEHHAKRPLYAALVPDEIFKGSHFERRFVTPFGGVWEKLATVAANAGNGKSEQGKIIKGTIKQERLRRIQEVLNNLEHPEDKKKRVKPDWVNEVAYIMEGDGEEIAASIVCDVYVERTTVDDKIERLAFELKSPLPNSDITKVSKEKTLKLYCMTNRQIDEAFFALPYNPYGKNKSDYVWSFPKRWFGMVNDPVVLIGEEFWERIGGEGTYTAFIEAVNEIGAEYKDRIYREFLGIEPTNSGITLD